MSRRSHFLPSKKSVNSEIERRAYLTPVLDLGLGDVLDGHLQPVPVPHARIHDAEAALAQHVSHLERRNVPSKWEKVGK